MHTAKSISEAALLWVPDFFDLVLLDVRQKSKEAVEFWRTIRRQHPGQRIRFLVGPPTYLSPTCAEVGNRKFVTGRHMGRGQLRVDPLVDWFMANRRTGRALAARDNCSFSLYGVQLRSMVLP